MARTVLLAQIFNNPNSVPPLYLNLTQASPVYRVALTAGQLALVGSGGAGGYTYSATGLPAGLSLNTATGSITGTPTTIGHNIVTATVTDSATNTFTTTFSIDVLTRLAGVNVAPPDIETGVPYSYQFSVSGATGTLSFTTSSYLMYGVSLSLSGLLSGTTMDAYNDQPYPLTINVSDSGTGDTLTIVASFTLWRKIQGAALNPLEVQATIPVSYYLPNFHAYGKPPYTYAPDPANPLPAWMSYDSVTRTLYGTPPVSVVGQPNVVYYRVYDALGQYAFITGNLVVDDQPQAAIQPQKSATNIGAAGPKNINFEFPSSGTPDVANDGTTMTVTIPIVAGGGSSGHGSTTTTAAPSASGGNWLFTVGDTTAFVAFGTPIYCSDSTNSIYGTVVNVISPTQITVAPTTTTGTVTSIANGSTFTFSGVAGPTGAGGNESPIGSRDIKPTLSMFPGSLGAGGATWSDQYSGILCVIPSNVFMHMRTQGAVSAPYTIDCHVSLDAKDSGGYDAVVAGIALTDGTKVRGVYMGYWGNVGPASADRLSIDYWPNLSTFGSQLSFQSPMKFFAYDYYVRLTDDGSTRKYWLSRDGIKWTLYYSESSSADGITPTHFALFVHHINTSSADCKALFKHWKVTNSVLGDG